MTGTMVVLQLVTPAPSADPLQRKMMAIGMPLFMLYVLWSAPSGLVLYWLVGNIVGFTQQFLINHWTKSDDEEVPPPPARAQREKEKDSCTSVSRNEVIESMTEAISQQAAEFLENVFEMTGLQLRVGVKQGIAGEVLDIEGQDAELLQAQTGEVA